VEDSNFCKALLFHDFLIRVARESLRRAFEKGKQKGEIKRLRCETLVSRKSRVSRCLEFGGVC